MAKTRAVKEKTLQDLTEKLGRAKSVVLADYQGLTMKQLSELRDKLHDQQSEFTVTKNTLLSRALKSSNYPDLDETQFEGPTATLLSFDDEITPIKLLVKALKDAAVGKIKAGFLAYEVLDQTKIQKLASLPSKDELRGQAVGVLVAPLSGMLNVLQGNLRNLVYALNQIQIRRLAEKGGVS